jgi:glycosyltransferase involved in cell wall biosynthesis
VKVAIVHDWLVTYAGAERVLEQMLNVFPNADLFGVVDFVPLGHREFLHNKKVSTTFIQKLPLASKKYRGYLPLMPMAIEQLDVSAYDLVISSSHAVAKGVITGPDQLHISYVHSPMRYAWELQHQYLRESGLTKGMKGWLAKYILHKIRQWDVRTSNQVDYFISNSHFIRRRVWKVYRRESSVIYPPVSVDQFTLRAEKEDFYLTASRFVPYKRIDLIVEAFSKMPSKQLIVIGEGPDFKKVKANAGPNVQLLGYQPSEVLKDYMQRARAFVFAAEEDFGITPIEAQACGTPVIAYGKGGVLETIRGLETSNPTGVFFQEQTVESIIDGVERFEQRSGVITATACRENAMRFSSERFRNEFRAFIEEKVTSMTNPVDILNYKRQMD